MIAKLVHNQLKTIGSVCFIGLSMLILCIHISKQLYNGVYTQNQGGTTLWWCSCGEPFPIQLWISRGIQGNNH